MTQEKDSNQNGSGNLENPQPSCQPDPDNKSCCSSIGTRWKAIIFAIIILLVGVVAVRAVITKSRDATVLACDNATPPLTCPIFATEDACSISKVKAPPSSGYCPIFAPSKKLSDSTSNELKTIDE